jgi:hypothetical protein
MHEPDVVLHLDGCWDGGDDPYILQPRFGPPGSN